MRDRRTDPSVHGGVHRRAARWGVPVPVAVVVGLVLIVAVVVAVLTARDGSPRSVTAPAAGSSSLTPAAPPASTRDVAPPSISLQAPIPETTPPPQPGIPVQVSVPRIRVSSPLEPLGLEKNGSLRPPSTFERAGWYARGARPGAIGPAVIAGHVDSRAGPAIFFDLKLVRLGDDIDVRDSAGVVRHFVVVDVQRYRKTRFPTEKVYGPTPEPVLRLITCTGAFDVAKRSYVDNLVVSATLRRPRAG